MTEHSKKVAMEIVDWIGTDQKRMDQLIKVFLDSHFRINQRAAWPLGIIGKKHPELLRKHVDVLTDQLTRTDVHDAVIRNVLRTFQFTKIPKDKQGRVVNACFDLLGDLSKPLAFRAFSMTVLWNIAQEEPDLIPELKLLIGEQMPYGTSGIKARGRKILAAIQKKFPED